MKGGEKVTFNYSKLIGRMAEKGETRESISNKLGISSLALRNKLSGKSQFKQDEMAKIIEVLDIDPERIAFYFFAE